MTTAAVPAPDRSREGKTQAGRAAVSQIVVPAGLRGTRGPLRCQRQLYRQLPTPDSTRLGSGPSSISSDPRCGILAHARSPHHNARSRFDEFGTCMRGTGVLESLGALVVGAPFVDDPRMVK